MLLYYQWRFLLSLGDAYQMSGSKSGKLLSVSELRTISYSPFSNDVISGGLTIRDGVRGRIRSLNV